ncbi:nodulin-related protein 1-like [Malania oleifera]|uniref:nodulin-related protein 1-like n=1 Tax=Malania oleifera TaxID=397392 RepID=UPI0025ADD152|nr:nodulin-related protein 1-like [Malania oleifera]
MESTSPDHKKHGGRPEKHHQPSSSELLSSAKLVADAAKSALRHDTDKLDKGRVAGAAADILDAASHYGKLDEKGFGTYVDKAGNYLHQYHTSHSTTVADGSGYTTTTTTTTHTAGQSPPQGDGGGHSGSGYGDYIKMAQGFMKKH